MRAEIKDGLIVLIPETEAERDAFAAWRSVHGDHVFHLARSKGRGGSLHDLGPRDQVLREPINVVFATVAPRWRPISNLAPSPFVLRGRAYASVEGFWQGLKFSDAGRRDGVAALSGTEAVRAGAEGARAGSFDLDGQSIAFGGPDHHALMREACWAKFTQCPEARQALLDTGERLLVHRTRRDSRTIPGALMADIWMRIRARLTHVEPKPRSIHYFDRDRELYGFLSHFEPSPIRLDGEDWPTVEHFYQAQKSFDPAYRADIRRCGTPDRAKQLSARAKPDGENAATSWFAETGQAPRLDWAEVKLDIMRRADWAKFTQNPHLAARLLDTGEAELVEDSPFDDYWGVGPDGKGLNWAGRVLMEIREKLRRGKGAVLLPFVREGGTAKP